jgi:AraC family transcriptional regulator
MRAHLCAVIQGARPAKGFSFSSRNASTPVDALLLAVLGQRCVLAAGELHGYEVVAEFAAQCVEAGAGRRVAFVAQAEHLTPVGVLGLDRLEIGAADPQVAQCCVLAHTGRTGLRSSHTLALVEVAAMTTDLIVPDQLPAWVPGDRTVHSPDTGWDGVSVRGYRYAGSDVGATAMSRELVGKGSHESLGPGVSLLTRASDSHWISPKTSRWCTSTSPATNLPPRVGRCTTARWPTSNSTVCSGPTNRPSTAPPLQRAGEAAHGYVGSRLIVDSLACGLSVHILRRHAHVRVRPHSGAGGLTHRQLHVISDHIRDDLATDLSRQGLADTVGAEPVSLRADVQADHRPRRARIRHPPPGRTRATASSTHPPTAARTSPLSVASPTRAT